MDLSNPEDARKGVGFAEPEGSDKPTYDELETRVYELTQQNAAMGMRLTFLTNKMLSSSELKLVDKHCDWPSFKCAWNAISSARIEAGEV